MQTLELNVHGMSCGSCVKHVRHALAGVVGVRDAQVDLALAKATVQADDAVTVDALRAAVVEAGYEVR